jgi:ferredoxin-NADP reductase
MADEGNHQRPNKVSLLFSAKTEAELLFRDEIDAACTERKGLSATYFVTGDNDASISNGVVKSRITAVHLRKHISHLNSDPDAELFCFLCGPNEMIKSLKVELADLGVSAENMFYELWW